MLTQAYVNQGAVVYSSFPQNKQSKEIFVKIMVSINLGQISTLNSSCWVIQVVVVLQTHQKSNYTVARAGPGGGLEGQASRVQEF